MFDQMTAAKKSKRLVGRDRTQLSMSKVREYRQTVERLKRLMLVTMHMSGGPPGFQSHRPSKVAPSAMLRASVLA